MSDLVPENMESSVPMNEVPHPTEEEVTASACPGPQPQVQENGGGIEESDGACVVPPSEPFIASAQTTNANMAAADPENRESGVPSNGETQPIAETPTASTEPIPQPQESEENVGGLEESDGACVVPPSEPFDASAQTANERMSDFAPENQESDVPSSEVPQPSAEESTILADMAVIALMAYDDACHVSFAEPFVALLHTPSCDLMSDAAPENQESGVPSNQPTAEEPTTSADPVPQPQEAEENGGGTKESDGACVEPPSEPFVAPAQTTNENMPHVASENGEPSVPISEPPQPGTEQPQSLANLALVALIQVDEANVPSLSEPFFALVQAYSGEMSHDHPESSSEAPQSTGEEGSTTDSAPETQEMEDIGTTSESDVASSSRPFIAFVQSTGGTSPDAAHEVQTPTVPGNLSQYPPAEPSTSGYQPQGYVSPFRATYSGYIPPLPHPFFAVVEASSDESSDDDIEMEELSESSSEVPQSVIEEQSISTESAPETQEIEENDGAGVVPTNEDFYALVQATIAKMSDVVFKNKESSESSSEIPQSTTGSASTTSTDLTSQPQENEDNGALKESDEACVELPSEPFTAPAQITNEALSDAAPENQKPTASGNKAPYSPAEPSTSGYQGPQPFIALVQTASDTSSDATFEMEMPFASGSKAPYPPAAYGTPISPPPLFVTLGQRSGQKMLEFPTENKESSPSSSEAPQSSTESATSMTSTDLASLPQENEEIGAAFKELINETSQSTTEEIMTSSDSASQLPDIEEYVATFFELLDAPEQTTGEKMSDVAPENKENTVPGNEAPYPPAEEPSTLAYPDPQPQECVSTVEETPRKRYLPPPPNPFPLHTFSETSSDSTPEVQTPIVAENKPPYTLAKPSTSAYPARPQKKYICALRDTYAAFVPPPPEQFMVLLPTSSDSSDATIELKRPTVPDNEAPPAEPSTSAYPGPEPQETYGAYIPPPSEPFVTMVQATSGTSSDAGLEIQKPTAAPYPPAEPSTSAYQDPQPQDISTLKETDGAYIPPPSEPLGAPEPTIRSIRMESKERVGLWLKKNFKEPEEASEHLTPLVRQASMGEMVVGGVGFDPKKSLESLRPKPPKDSPSDSYSSDSD